MVDTQYRTENIAVNKLIRLGRQSCCLAKGNFNHMGGKQRIEKDKATSTGREGGKSGEQPSLNNSSQLRQGQKTMGLLTGDWELRGLLHAEITCEHGGKNWELCRMINHMVYDYVALDLDPRLLHNG